MVDQRQRSPITDQLEHEIRRWRHQVVDTRQTLCDVSRQLVKQSAATMQSEFSGLDAIVENALGELNEMHLQLAFQAKALDARAAGLDQREQELNERQRHAERLLHEVEFPQAHWNELLEEVRGVRSEVRANDDGPLVASLNEMQSQVRHLQETLGAPQEDAQVMELLADLRREILSAQEQIQAVGNDVLADASDQPVVELLQQVQTQVLAMRGEVATRDDSQELVKRVSQWNDEVRESHDVAGAHFSEQLLSLVVTVQGELHQTRNEVARHVEHRQEETLQEIHCLRDTWQQQRQLEQSWQDQVVEMMQQQWTRAEEERQEYWSQVTEALSEVRRIEQMSMDLAKTRDEIAVLHASLQAETRGTQQSGRPQQELAKQIDALEQERSVLEMELELVRSRAAELYETVENQHDVVAEQHHEMVREVQQLKATVQHQMEMVEYRLAGDAAGPSAEQVAVSKPSLARATDPVVNSVASQFAKLQQEASQRRSRFSGDA